MLHRPYGITYLQEVMMSTYVQHTPRPWVVCAGKYSCVIRIGQAVISAPYQPPHGRGRCAVQEADARLIAAAPDYFDAVERMLAFETAGGDGWWKAWEMVKAAHTAAKVGAT